MSKRQQPRSRSSWVRQDSAEASGSRTVSVMRMPALFAAVTRFCVAATENLVTAANKAGILITDTVLEPLASAEACLTQDERDLGCCLLDKIGRASCRERV